MILEVGGASPEPREHVNIRKIHAHNQCERGKACLPIEPGMAEGDGGEGVSEIVHAKTRKPKLQNRNLKPEILTEILSEFRVSDFQFRISERRRSLPSPVAMAPARSARRARLRRLPEVCPQVPRPLRSGL